MATTTTTAAAVIAAILRRTALPAFRSTSLLNSKRVSPSPAFLRFRTISSTAVRCAATKNGDAAGRKTPSRLEVTKKLMFEAEERANAAANDGPPPKIQLEHVSVSFARSGGPGGQNVNKVSTKVDMRFNVKKATWLSERIRDKILLLEKNKINKDGELVISSTKTRTQLGNIEDCLSKLQAILDAASYVPPPPSEDQKKKIAKLAAKSEQKRLQNKKLLAEKKQSRSNKNSWG